VRMSIEKIKAFVLKTLPYGESSGIFYLLTEGQGLVHGIARGIHRKKASASFLERGFLIETMLYVRLHRELHTLGDIHIVNYFPAMRSNLIKTALRDAAFETILTAVSIDHPYPELFALAAKFLDCLERQAGNSPALLWKFFYEFSALLGFGFSGEACLVCGKKAQQVKEAYMVTEKGGFACENCVAQKDRRNMIPPALLTALKLSDDCTLEQGIATLSATDARRITRLLAAYCHFHGETKTEYKALEFLDTVLFNEQLAK